MAKRYFKFVTNPFNPLDGVRVDFFPNSNGGTNYPCIDTALSAFINQCEAEKLRAIAESDQCIAEANRIAKEIKNLQAKEYQWPEVVYSIHEALSIHKYSIHEVLAIHKHEVVFAEKYADTIMVQDLDTNDKLFYCVDIEQHVTPTEFLAKRGYYTSPELAVRAYKAKIAAQLDALLSGKPNGESEPNPHR